MNKLKIEPTILSTENSKWLVEKLSQVDTSMNRINQLREQARSRLKNMNLVKIKS